MYHHKKLFLVTCNAPAVGEKKKRR